jgi:hypothetical protein
MPPEQPQPATTTTTEQAPPPTEVAAERREFSLQYVRDVLSGKIMPPPLVVPPPVKKNLQSEPMSEGARQWLGEELSLGYYYGGQPIFTFRTKAGHKVVLAVGLDEIRALRDGVPYEECRDVVFECPEPW